MLWSHAGSPRRHVPPAALLAAMLIAAATAAGPSDGSFAEIMVRTLVIDPLGTRTVDTDSARVPVGSRGLLVKQVPYAGPPLSFRLSVLASEPQSAGIPLVVSSETWSGEVSSPPPADRMSRREEATVLGPESSYLLELDHDPRTDRRLVLSITAREGDGRSVAPPSVYPTPRAVDFLLEVVREKGGVADPPDSHTLTSMVGRPVTYSSGIKYSGARKEPAASAPEPGAADRTEPQVVGLAITLVAESAQASLVTVRMEITGAELVDERGGRLEPFSHRAVHTVDSGTRYETTLTVPQGAPAGAERPDQALVPVKYWVAVTPTLSRDWP